MAKVPGPGGRAGAGGHGRCSMAKNGLRKELAGIFGELATVLEQGRAAGRGPVILTTGGSELGEAELVEGAELAAASGIEVVLVGPAVSSSLPAVVVGDEREAHQRMEKMLEVGEAKAAVTLHYSFPIGVSTVGRVLTPARGRSMFIATTTGTSSTQRIEAMVRNAVYGVATAKACGIAEPTVGILNLDGARQVERALRQLIAGGYPLKLGTSMRSDGGSIMRGNDLLAGTVDVMVTDSLTGNVLMKMFSAFTSGGEYEATGWGYGPGVGPGCDKLICILSRASGAPVVANAIGYAARVAEGNLLTIAGKELAGVDRVQRAVSGSSGGTCPQVESLKAAVAREARQAAPSAEIRPKVATEEIGGIDILEIEDAAAVLTHKLIYGRTGMGCTGPVILVAHEDKEAALVALREAGYLQ